LPLRLNRLVDVKWASVALFSLTTAALAQQPVLEISGANFRPMPLAVAMPVIKSDAVKAAAPEFDSALTFDFSACGLFQVLDRKSFLANANEGFAANEVQFQSWSNVGAEALVKVQLAAEGEQLKGELRVYSVGASREEMKVSDAVSLKEPRKLAHKLANAVYKFYTKETGPFETHIAFARKVAGGKEVFLSDWDSRRAQQVTTGSINVLPAVLPQGGGVAYTSYRKGRPQLYTQRVGAEPVALPTIGNMVSGVAFAPGGARMAFSVSDGERAEIYVASADGSNAQKLTDTKYFLNSSPSWSPDGKRIAFVSNRAGSPQIYLMNADGSEAKRLTFQGTYNTTPAFSPRGDVVAFTARDERNIFDIFTVNVGSGKVVRLTQNARNNEEPAFSPNGRLILFTSTRNGLKQLFVMTVDGNNQVPLPSDKAEYDTPDWGP
jgi:TolB protein